MKGGECYEFLLKNARSLVFIISWLSASHRFQFISMRKRPGSHENLLMFSFCCLVLFFVTVPPHEGTFAESISLRETCGFSFIIFILLYFLYKTYSFSSSFCDLILQCFSLFTVSKLCTVSLSVLQYDPNSRRGSGSRGRNSAQWLPWRQQNKQQGLPCNVNLLKAENMLHVANEILSELYVMSIFSLYLLLSEFKRCTVQERTKRS